ncbi:MAG: GAF domain-containing sensor histidine kinase [Anaerolineales bacterium]|nr:GAF domain-containing sensor histidine kinase [Anaerolineales bacterium]
MDVIQVSQPNNIHSNALGNTSASPGEAGDPDKLGRVTKEIKEVTTLYNIGVAVGSSLDLKEVIKTLYKESRRLIDTSNFAIVLYDALTETLTFRLMVDQGKVIKPMTVKLAEDRGLTGRVLTSQAPLLISDFPRAKNGNSDSNQPDKYIRSWLGVPILNPVVENDSAQGVIATWSYKPHAFNDHDLWLLSAIATQAAIAIRNARLFESSQRRAAEMVLLNDVARTLSSTLQLDEVLTRIMQQVEGMLNVEAGSLLLTDPATGELVFQIALGDKADEVKPFRIPRGQGIAGEVALTGNPLMIANVDEDKRHFKVLDQTTNFLTRNILCVPLVLYDQIIGVLEVMNKREGNFTQNDLELLSSIASYAAIAIQNARLHQSVLAERDKVIEAEEEARKKLARDLHDGPTQLVAGIKMSLDFSKKALEKEPSLLPKELAYMQELADRATHQMRTMLFELRPLVLETQGLGAALQVFLERRQQDITGETPKLALKIETSHPGGDISRQDGKVEAAIFAIVQETVNNAIKHAQARNIVVQLTETATAVYTVIKDDGKGFDVDQVMNNYEQRGSLGMINLKERTQLIGGELSIRSAPGHGTRITIQVPKEDSERLRKRNTTGTLSLSGRLMQTGQFGQS